MSVARKSFALLSRDILVMCAKIVTAAVIARKLGPEAMGIWIVLTLLPAYAEAAGRLKMDVAAVYFLGIGKYRLGDVSFVLMIVSLASGIGLVGIGVWKVEVLERYLFPGAGVDRIILYAVLLTIPLNFLSLNFSYLLIHLEDVRSYNRLVILRSLVPSFLAVFLILCFGWKLLSLVLATMLSAGLAVVYGFWKAHRQERLRPNLNIPMVKELLSYGANTYVAGLMSQLYTYFSSLVAARFIFPSEVAFFRMAQDNAQLANKVPEALNTVLYPTISKISASSNDAEKLAARACRISVVLLGLVGAVAAAGVYPMVYLLYGPAYLPMVVPFLIVLPGVLAYGCTEPLSQYFQGTGRARVVLKLSFVPLLTQIILSLLLIPRWGVLGASAATSATLLSTALARSLVFRVRRKLKLSGTFIPKVEDVATVFDFLVQILKNARLLPMRSAS